MKNAGFVIGYSKIVYRVKSDVLSHNVLYYYRVTNVLLRPMQRLDLTPEYYRRLDSTLRQWKRGNKVQSNMYCMLVLLFAEKKTSLYRFYRMLFLILFRTPYTVINFNLRAKGYLF